MNVTEYGAAIAGELKNSMERVNDAETEALVDALLAARAIFLAGAGRSGLMIKAFAMRLMHMGFNAYVVGETVTPNIGAGDLLLIGSGSGETASLVSMANKARKLGARVALATIFPRSSIGSGADVVVAIPAPTPKAKTDAGVSSIQPMGSLFEQSLLLVLDAVILRLMEKKGLDSDAMFGRHANLE